MAPAAALKTRAFDAALEALGPFERRPHVAIAVSGGADSLALALLAADWAKRVGGRITALTVDHGLRRAAAGEARQVAAWLTARGIAHVVLRWRGIKPSTGIQQAARAARYALLEEWCRAHSVLHLLLAHHRDDQIETARLRAAAGSGPLGRAGMSVIVERAHIRLLRPLLAFGKAPLLAFLVARGQSWIEDPSNRDLRFARARLRQQATPDPRGPDFGVRRANLERATAECLAQFVELHPAGWAWLDPAVLSRHPAPTAELALARALTTIGGATYAPATAGLRRVFGWLAGAPRGGMTLGGCRLIAGNARDRVLVCREAGRIGTDAALRAGEIVLWDGRYALAATGRRGSIEALQERRPPGWPPPSVPGAARAALPCVRSARGPRVPVALPGLAAPPDAPARREPGFSAVFRPRRALGEAAFVPARAAPRRKKTIV